jgi:hypothetical protein
MVPRRGEDVGVAEVGIDGSESKASGARRGAKRRCRGKGRNKELWGKMPTGEGVAGGREKEWMGEK